MLTPSTLQKIPEIAQQLRDMEALSQSQAAIIQQLQTTLAETERRHQLQLAENKYEAQVHFQLITGQKEFFEQRWQDLQATIGWVLVQKLQDLRTNLAPPQSGRDFWLEQFLKTVKHYRLSAGLAFLAKHYQQIWQFERGQLSQSDLATQLAPAAEPYQAWIARSEPTTEQLQQQRQASFAYRPMISIVMPIYNPPLPVLREAIQSVLAQTYPEWQLCLVNGGSTVAGLRELLTELAQPDSRIIVQHLAHNQGISGNSNEALKLATGEFVLFFDHDDTLAPHMLYEVIQSLHQQPDTDVIYFDEDKLSADGTTRLEPFFKPDWSPHLLLSTNYLTHFVVRRQLLAEVGGFNSQLDGAQDWDFALRCIEQTTKIRHIPKILYHWRKMSGSTAGDVAAKPWVYQAQITAIESHLHRLGTPQAQAVLTDLGLMRVIWPISGAKVSIIIPTKDKLELLLPCVASILKLTRYPNYEIILVDSGSTDYSTLHYYEFLKTDPRLKIVPYHGQFNYSTANNLGVSQATGEIFLFLNNDTQVFDEFWLTELVGWAERPEVGVVGAKLIRPDGTIQHAGIIMGLKGHCDHIFDGQLEYQFGLFGLSEWYRDYQAVTGACMMLRRAVFEQLGGFDETYQISWSDVEICLRARAAGYAVVYTPFARLLHHEGASRGSYAPHADFIRASVQLLPYIAQDDPYFNPNLSYAHPNPTFAPTRSPDRVHRLMASLRNLNLVNHEDKAALAVLYPYITTTLKSWPHTSLLNQGGQRGVSRLMWVMADLGWHNATLMGYELARELLAQGYKITLYAPRGGVLQIGYEQLGVTVHLEPRLFDPVTGEGDSLILSQFVSQYDVVIAHTLEAWQAIHVARAFQRPSVWWLHETETARVLAHKGVAQAFRAAEAVIVPTEAAAKLYAPMSARHNVIVAPYSVTLSQQIVALPAKTRFTLVQVAAISPANGQETLLQALAALPAPIRQQINCYIVGPVTDEIYFKQLQKSAEPLAQVQFIHDVTLAQTVAYLQAADVVVSLSQAEALPWAILQAMSLGKAVITSHLTGTAEVIQSTVNGLLLSPHDYRAVTICLMRLFYDRNYREQLGQAAQTQCLSHNRLGQQLDTLIQQLSITQ